MRPPHRLLPILLAAVSTPALAQEAARAPAQWWADVNVASHHFGDTSDYLAAGEHFNEANYGAGVEVQWQPRHAVSAGYYRNSVDEDSWYALYHYTPLPIGRHVRLGVMVGGVTGYPGYNDGGLAPAGALVAKVDYRRVGMNLIRLPPIPDVTPSTLGLQVKVRLDH